MPVKSVLVSAIENGATNCRVDGDLARRGVVMRSTGCAKYLPVARATDS